MDYVNICELIKPYLESKSEILPDAIRTQLFKALAARKYWDDINAMNAWWDKLTPAARQYELTWWDYLLNPNKKEERNIRGKVYSEFIVVSDQIRYWEKLSDHGLPSEAKIKYDQLVEFADHKAKRVGELNRLSPTNTKAKHAQNNHPSKAATQIESGTVTNLTRNKIRRNILDPIIERAITQAGTAEFAEVFLALKDFALAGERPFTGEVNGSSLFYTNASDEIVSLGPDALRQRLKRRSKAN